MSTTRKIGEVTWSEDTSTKKFEKREFVKEDYLNLVNGDNEVRILTPAFQYYAHQYKIEGEQGFGHRINCAKIEKDDSCPLCDMQVPVHRRWRIKVLDRKSGMVKLLDFKSTIYDGIKLLANGKFGSPLKYDIKIIKDPNASTPGKFYQVTIADLPSPLTQDEMKLKDAINLDEMQERVQPPSAERVMLRIKALHEKVGIPMANMAAPTAFKSNGKGKLVVDMSDSSEEVPEFPNADSNSEEIPF